MRVEFVASKTFTKFSVQSSYFLQNVSLINRPIGTVIFQVQVPFPGNEGKPGVEKVSPSPSTWTMLFCFGSQVPDITVHKKSKHVFAIYKARFINFS